MKPERHSFKRTVKLLISAGFYFGTCARNLFLRIAGIKPRFGCVVLYYHSVPTETRGRFARQMDAVARLTKPIDANPHSPLDPGVRYSAITFDDAFENAIENALPELRKRNIPATIFVTTNVLGERARWWPEQASERTATIASEKQIKELPADLVSIGSHTLSHPMLPLLSEAEARRELSESRAKLEEMLRHPVTTLSFPFGAFNEDLVHMCRDAGYERVFTTLPVMAFGNGEFVTGRVPAEPTDWPLEFRLKLVGAYRWLPYAFAIKKRLLSTAWVRRHRAIGNGAEQSVS